MRVMLFLFCCFIVVGCSEKKTEDFSSWDKERVYTFLNAVQHHVNKIPAETNNKQDIITMYEKYFSSQLSEDIFNSLYVETEDGWRIPDGDGGYIFSVPNNEQNTVNITKNKDTIIIEEIYEPETWMYTKMSYTITYDEHPVITGWTIEN